MWHFFYRNISVMTVFLQEVYNVEYYMLNFLKLIDMRQMGLV